VEGEGITFLEKAMRFGSKFQENENSAQVSLFGETSEVQIAEPQVPPCEEWSTMEKLAKEKEVVGIYLSGHPLDDYSHEMKYFCNTKLEAFKDLNPLIGKNIAVGGIITKVEHRTTKNGKGWAVFTLEGYDESYEFKIFDEEYLKYRHFLIQNSFTYIRIMIREGWINKETGKKSDPRIQFLDMKMLADVLSSFAKKLILRIDIKMLEEELIQQLQTVFSKEQGEHPLTIEVVEVEKVKKEILNTSIPQHPDTDSDEETIELAEQDEELGTSNAGIPLPESTLVEEIIELTKISMPSRKWKVKITKELLVALEQLNMDFRLN
jgi:DNA polymerase-3 subunit alpha